MSIQSPQATVWEGCSYLDYIRDASAISRSMLSVYRESPRLYEARFVSRTIAPPDANDAFRLGTATHTFILEPTQRHSVQVIPPKVLTKDGKRFGKAWDEYAEANKHLCLIKQSEFDHICRLVDAVWANGPARSLLEMKGDVEQTIAWHDPQTGLKCKSRRDKVCDGLIVDLKTAASASPGAFAKSAASCGYHNQQAFYLGGQLALTGEAFDFVFIVVGKEPPHEVAVYQLDADDVALGHRQNQEALEEISERLQDNRWHAPYEASITTIALPKWAHHQDDWRL